MPEISTGHQQRKCRFDSGSFVEAWQDGGRFDSVIGRWATKDMTPRKDGGQHRSPPGLSMRHPSADGRNGGNSCGQPGTVRRRFGMPCRWASVLVGGRLRSGHPLKSRAKACSDTYRSEGHQSAGKIDSVAREKRPQRQSWVPLVTHSAQWQQGGFATR